MSASASPCLPALCLALSLPLAGAALAQAPASGQFRFGENVHAIVDAIAYRDDADVVIVFSDTPYDRAEFAEDLKLDMFDFMRHDGATLSLRVDADGFGGLTLAGGGTSSSQYSGELKDALTLTRQEDARIAGRFDYADQHRIEFDLPVQSATMERPGTRLPDNGGEPGKVLLERVAAIHAGDFDRLVAATPPEQAAEMLQAKADGELEMLMSMAQLFTPADVKITGGHQDGDRAWVDFTGTESGSAVTGTAILVRNDGRWHVVSMNTRHGID